MAKQNPRFDREHFLAVVRGEKELNSKSMPKQTPEQWAEEWARVEQRELNKGEKELDSKPTRVKRPDLDIKSYDAGCGCCDNVCSDTCDCYCHIARVEREAIRKRQQVVNEKPYLEN